MKRRIKTVILATTAITALLSIPSSFAQQAAKPETLIKLRQSAFQLIAWNSSRIKASLEGQYNKDEVVKAANSISAIANSGLGALFAPGSEQGKGWHDTAAKPELFKDGKHFGELGANFGKEANTLASIASSADAAAIKEQYGKLTRTCKACHDDFKSKD